MLDYNKLMEELGNCLGLEKPATESISKKGSKSAVEEYDEVERELAEELGEPVPETVSEDDLVFDENKEEASPDEGVVVNKDQDKDQDPEESDADLFKESVKSFFNRLLNDKSPEEAKEEIGKLFGEVLSEVCPECGEGCEDEEDEEDGVTPETEEEPETVEETKPENDEEEEADEGCCKSSKENCEEDPEAAFESLRARMLSRYSSLARKKNKKGTATEGVKADTPELDDYAISRTSAEFGYSGKNLRKMVAEAIQKGVI